MRQLVDVLEQHTNMRPTPTRSSSSCAGRRAGAGQAQRSGPAAAARWEEIARLDPDDAKALDSLTEIYTKLERHADLARVLDMQVDRVVADPKEQAAYLRKLAALAEGPLNDIRRAQRSWENICEVLPTDTEALDALSRIYSGEGDWATLVRILDKQIPLARDPTRAVELALLRAQIFDERLHNTEDAAHALEQVIAELNPRSWEAHERLRALYEKAGSWARVVKVAERQLFLAEDPASARRARWSWRCCGATACATPRRRRPRSSACWRSTRTTWRRCARWRRSISRRRTSSG